MSNKNLMIVALLLVIAIGFVAILTGLRKPKVVEIVMSTEEVVALPTLNMLNSFPITFGDADKPTIIYIEQKTKTYNQENFAAMPSQSYNSSKTKLDELYLKPDWASFQFHDLDTDKYLTLEPSGQKEISLVTESDLVKLTLPPKAVFDNVTGTQITATCNRNQTKVGLINAVAVSCKTKVVLINENNRVADESTTINCYLPYKNGFYLAFKQLAKPISTDVDMCEILNSLGYQNISDVKD